MGVALRPCVLPAALPSPSDDDKDDASKEAGKGGRLAGARDMEVGMGIHGELLMILALIYNIICYLKE